MKAQREQLLNKIHQGEEVIPEETTLTFTVSQGLEKVPLEDLTIYDKSELDDYADETV